MSVKQISVFVENKPGKLAAVTRTIADFGINLRAMSIADTQDFGILRIITEHPESDAQLLAKAGYLTKLNNVLAVEMPDKPGALADILDALAAAGVGVEYTYAFISSIPGKAYMIFRVDDVNKYSESALANTEANIVTQEDIFG